MRIWILILCCIAQNMLMAQPGDSLIAEDTTSIVDSALALVLPPDTAQAVLELAVGEAMRVHPPAHSPWLIGLVVLYWSLFAFLRLFNNTLFQYRLRALVNFNLAHQYFRDEAVFSSTLHALYHLHFLFGFSLFSLLLGRHFGWIRGDNEVMILGLIFSAFIGLYLIRAFAGWVIHRLFRVRDTLRFAQFYSNLTYCHISYGLMPVVTIGFFAPPPWPGWAIAVGLVGLTIGMLWRYYRGYQIVKAYFLVYKHHLIAYICTAEIAPALLLIKGVSFIIPLVS